MMEYALAYAARGWRVFPLIPRGKLPLIAKDAGGRGCLDATTDEAQIRRWWDQSPAANIGLATGDFIFALDIDPIHQGDLWLESVTLPETIHQHTGSGGTHYLFSGPVEIPNSAGRIAPGVDIRGAGGYIVAPPSVHPNGRRYSWVDCDGDIPAGEPTAAPEWLVTAAMAGVKKQSAAAVIGPVITKGTQHDTLYRFACSMWGGKVAFTEDEVLAAVVVLSKRCQEIPPEINVEKIVRSVTRKHAPGLSAEYADTMARSAPSADAGIPVSGIVVPVQVSGHAPAGPWPHEAASNAEVEPDEEPEKPLVYTPWPEPLSAAAFHGPIGEMCRLIEPNTEADIAAVLFQALVMIGNVVGRGVHWVAEAIPHYANEFVGVVGATAKGRKGSSFGQVRRVIGGLDQNWAKFRIKSGLTSGEGLIFHVRDAVREIKTTRGKTEEVVTDPGETDKRMLVVEEELATAIKAMSREGNTLSGVLRQAWDSPLVLAPMTKNNRITASHPHVSIIGHITRDELLKSLKAVENTNGGTNRFLWCCARRSKLLPFGGQSGGEEMAAVSARLDHAIGWAQTVTQEIGMDGEAAEMWAIVYEELGDVPAGTVGAILSRAEAHVRRVAMIYAAIDRSLYVRPAHLEAALDVWRYSAASVRWIFGDVPSAEQLKQGRVLKAISDAGANRREITQAMGGKIAGSDLEFHLGELMTTGKIRLESEKRGKRACEYYYPVY